MRIIIIIFYLSAATHMNAQDLYNFTSGNTGNDWYIVDDVVMGGRSNGQFYISDAGYGIFTGEVSLENNGGFSSVRYRMPETTANAHSAFKIRLKGDGKNYQFRTRSGLNESHSYIYEFETTGDWQVIEVPFSEMYPGFRGMRLQRPNYPGERISECSFLISNKKNESFRLEIDRIWME